MVISTAFLHYLHSGGGGGSTTGYPGGRGGTAGGDGEQSPFSARGGAGSGADIAQFVFSTWSLVPGAGGAGEYNRAGGGGGVLVTEGGVTHGGRGSRHGSQAFQDIITKPIKKTLFTKSPPHLLEASATCSRGDGVTDGEGFGAGSGNGWAEKGLVLVEIA